MPTSIKELDLLVRYTEKLERAGIHTVEALCEKRPCDLLLLRGVGIGCLNAVRYALAEIGLALRDDTRNNHNKEVTLEGKFDEWAILELMGHRRLAGKVSDAVIGGGAFLRIDIPGKDNTMMTQYYSPGSVYCITPTTEETARVVACQVEPAPVSRWEMERLVALKSGNTVVTDEDKEL